MISIYNPSYLTRDMAAGYDRIAAFLASDPPSMFVRRFARLNAKNILYYQAELADLEADLEDIIGLDRDSASRDGGNEKHYPFSIGHLKGTLGNSKNVSMQWEKFLEIRRLLKEYSVFLIIFSCTLFPFPITISLPVSTTNTQARRSPGAAIPVDATPQPRRSRTRGISRVAQMLGRRTKPETPMGRRK